MQKQVIVIKLDGLLYGIDVSVVQEVVYSFIDRALPEAPNFIEGLAYIRDNLLPIIRIKRLFDSPFFDLYSNKRILVLNFNNNKFSQEVSQAGVIVDEVIGIEYYEDFEIKPVGSVYSPQITEHLDGFIQKGEKEIALFNITSFFYNKNGEFRFKQFFGKQQAEIKEISRADYTAIATLMEEAGFPLDELSTKAVIVYISKIAAFNEKSIKDLLEEKPFLITSNKYMEISPIKDHLFYNFGDMYSFSEYLELAIKTMKGGNVLVVDSGDTYDMLSIMFILEMYKKKFMQFNFINMGSNKEVLEEKASFVYKKENLATIPDELHEKFFDILHKEEEEDVYHLKKELIKNITLSKINLESLVEEKKEFSIIYAPNYLIQNKKDLQKNIKIFEKLLAKNGVLVLGLFEDIGDFEALLKRHYIKSRLFFVKE